MLGYPGNDARDFAVVAEARALQSCERSWRDSGDRSITERKRTSLPPADSSPAATNWRQGSPAGESATRRHLSRRRQPGTPGCRILDARFVYGRAAATL